MAQATHAVFLFEFFCLNKKALLPRSLPLGGHLKTPQHDFQTAFVAQATRSAAPGEIVIAYFILANGLKIILRSSVLAKTKKGGCLQGGHVVHTVQTTSPNENT